MYDKLFISQILLITIYTTFGSDLFTNKTANVTFSLNETKRDSNITWIKISPITVNTTANTTTVAEHVNKNCTITENTSNETQNLDIASSLRRKRRKRRRNKYKAWNQRRPEHSYKKHSTRVELNKPVQFLIPPDYQENLIPTETAYYKNRNDGAEKFTGRAEKKIPPPVRHLLPPLIDTQFLNSINTIPTPIAVKPEPKKSKHIEWSPNNTNRGSTKFKHTIYYSDSGNEIISNYEITPTTAVSQIKHTTSNDNLAFTSRAGTESPRNQIKLEHRPIVVQPTPIQYRVSNYPSSENRINNLVSPEVANAGMQVINMTMYQLRKSPIFQNQLTPNNDYKQPESSSILRPSVSPLAAPSQQPTSQSINHQQQYHPGQESIHQGNHHLQSHDRVSPQINYQQQQGYQQLPSPDRNSHQINYQQQQGYQQLPSPVRNSHQINYQQPQFQQISNYQQSQSSDRFPQQINHKQSPLPEQILQQTSYLQHSTPDQYKPNQNQQSLPPQQQQINYSHSRPQQPISVQPNYQQYQQTQSSQPNTASHSQNFQQIELLQPHQTNDQRMLQNYQHKTTYSRATEMRSTTPTPRLISNQTTTPQIDDTRNSKGLDLAESKYFSDIPSEQEFNAVQNDGQVIPGIAGKDYPVFDQFLLQKRRFSCRGLEGYFADVTSRCQVFYICNGDGAGEPMLCPNGTLFSQELLVCDWWYNVDC